MLCNVALYICTCSCSSSVVSVVVLVVVVAVVVALYLLKTKLFCEASSVFELDNIKNAAIQRDFLSF